MIWSSRRTVPCLRIATIALASLLTACATAPYQAPIGGTGSSTPSGPISLGIGAQEIARVDALLSQTRELLLLAPDVARIKWNAKQSVANPKAETALVDAAAREAPNYKADPGLFRDFFQAQVDASRFVQIELFKQWRAANTPPLTLTRSVAQVQAASDAITPALMQALADAAPVLKIPGARAMVESRAREILPTRSALSDPTRDIAIRPLLFHAAP